MKLCREPGTCFWCGDRQGAHPWKICPAKGRTCSSCGGNDHFARVCLEDPKFTVRDSRSNPSTTTSYARRGANGQRRDSRQSGQRDYPPTQSRDLRYTDMSVRDEQQYDTSFDHDCGFTYSLEAQVHSVAASSQAKRYFTTLALSTTGSAFTQVLFQIDTAATCNTMSLSTLRSFLPDADLKRSPYRLYPYRNSKLLEPEGQIDLVCERQDLQRSWSAWPACSFQVEENVQPVQMPVHRIPVAKRECEKQALDLTLNKELSSRYTNQPPGAPMN